MSSGAMHDGVVIGVDVGGTKIATGLVRATGEILYQTRQPMVANDGAESGLAAVKSAIQSVTAQATDSLNLHGPIQGIGICAPGPLDPKTGVVLNPPNLPCWRDFPLAAEISKIYRVRVRVENDANAAGLAETLWGAGRGYAKVFYVTVGTGIGTAIVLDAHIYGGRTGSAGEGGHVSIDYHGPRCGCGKPGCIEALASGPAIARRARAKLEAGGRSSLLERAGGKLELVTCAMVGQAHADGDLLASEVLHETVELFAFWLGNIVDLLEPDIMIIGGGVSSLLTPFFGEIQDHLVEYCVNRRCREIPLVQARYGEDAGVAGGAALCFEGAS